MQKVSIETSQNVSINFPVAGLGERIAAYLIDALVMSAYMFVIAMLFFLFIGLGSSFEIYDLDDESLAGLIALVTIFMLPLFFYHLISELYMDGQSIGKRQMKIKVVKLNGTQPRLGDFVLRWIMRLVDIQLYGIAAILCILIGGKGQRLGDLAAGTAVIKLSKPKVTDKHRVIKSLGNEDYKPMFYSAERLSENDIKIINESLRVYRNSANKEPLKMVANKIKAILGIESDLQDVQFLNIILKDHNYLAIHGR